MAQDTDVLRAMDAGLTHIIHVWSAGEHHPVREGPWRKPGLLEASLTFDGLTVILIADNRHLPPTLHEAGGQMRQSRPAVHRFRR